MRAIGGQRAFRSAAPANRGILCRDRRLRLAPRLLVAALLCGSPLPLVAQQSPETRMLPRPSDAGLPAGLEIELRGGEAREEPNGDIVITGPVTIIWRETRFQADRLKITEKRYVEAEGNILLIWGPNRVAGTRMTYDLETESGTIENAIGQVPPEYLFWAKQAHKVGANVLKLRSATVTTCTQPSPYWSFAVSSATITLDKYAVMKNARIKIRPVPVFYLPVLVWPVKPNRAQGLLFPEFHSTQNRGRAITQEYFIPIGRSADLTLFGRYYTEAGFGGGGELRFIPNRRGSARFNGFFINDRVAGRNRHRATYSQTQEFQNGFRMLADINLVSDFDFYSDFERDLNLVSSPTILARLEFSRNGPWTSLNVREQRREQLRLSANSTSNGRDTTLVQQTLPELEWRGRSRKLGKTPFYLSFESGLASIQQRIRNPQPSVPAFDADYGRADIFPTLSLPWSRWPWLDINPFVSYRLTHYTQRQLEAKNPGGGSRLTVIDDDITRTLWGAGLEIIGPKLFRIFETPNSSYSKKYKHSIEPGLTYGFFDPFDRGDEIIVYDEVDRFAGAGEQVNYRIVQRLMAHRPRTLPRAPVSAEETIVMPDGTTSAAGISPGALSGADPSALPMPPPEVDPENTVSVEMATLTVNQSRSYERQLSFADLDGDGINEETSPFSSVSLLGRFNPSPATSIDLRSSYHILYKEIEGVTISGNLRQRLARFRFSVVHRRGLGFRPVTRSGPDVKPSTTFVPRDDDTQVRLTTGLNLFRDKIQLDLDTSWDADPPAGQPHFSDKRWRLQYRTQCCTFLVEQLIRDFSNLSARDDIYFRIDLRGVGKLLDFSY